MSGTVIQIPLSGSSGLTDAIWHMYFHIISSLHLLIDIYDLSRPDRPELEIKKS